MRRQHKASVASPPRYPQEGKTVEGDEFTRSNSVASPIPIGRKDCGGRRDRQKPSEMPQDCSRYPWEGKTMEGASLWGASSLPGVMEIKLKRTWRPINKIKKR